MLPSVPLHEILEKDWQRSVRDLAAQLGYAMYHTFDSRKSDTGFPDLVLVSRQRRRVVYLELKREEVDDRGRVTGNGKVTDRQAKWIRDLHYAGAEVYLARPRNLDDLAVVLGGYGSTRVLAQRRLVIELEPYLEAQ